MTEDKKIPVRFIDAETGTEVPGEVKACCPVGFVTSLAGFAAQARESVQRELSGDSERVTLGSTAAYRSGYNAIAWNRNGNVGEA